MEDTLSCDNVGTDRLGELFSDVLEDRCVSYWSQTLSLNKWYGRVLKIQNKKKKERKKGRRKLTVF